MCSASFSWSPWSQILGEWSSAFDLHRLGLLEAGRGSIVCILLLQPPAPNPPTVANAYHNHTLHTPPSNPQRLDCNLSHQTRGWEVEFLTQKVMVILQTMKFASSSTPSVPHPPSHCFCFSSCLLAWGAQQEAGAQTPLLLLLHSLF